MNTLSTKFDNQRKPFYYLNMILNILGWTSYLIGLIWGSIVAKKEAKKRLDACSFVSEAIKTGDQDIYEEASLKLRELELQQIGLLSSYSIKSHFTVFGLGFFISNIIIIFSKL